MHDVTICGQSKWCTIRSRARFEVVHDLAKSCTILQNRDRARFGEIVHDLADRNRARLGLMRFLISNVFRFIFKNVCNFPQKSTPPCSEIRLRGEIHFCLHFQRDFDENVRNSPERYKDTRWRTRFWKNTFFLFFSNFGASTGVFGALGRVQANFVGFAWK